MTDKLLPSALLFLAAGIVLGVIWAKAQMGG
jgi:hypothetical protein